MADWITADLDSIVEGTKKCLERLQMDYVDVIFAHGIAPTTLVSLSCTACTSTLRGKPRSSPSSPL